MFEVDLLNLFRFNNNKDSLLVNQKFIKHKRIKIFRSSLVVILFYMNKLCFVDLYIIK